MFSEPDIPHLIGSSALPSCPGLSVYWVGMERTFYEYYPLLVFTREVQNYIGFFRGWDYNVEEQFHHLLYLRAGLHTTTLVSDFSQLCLIC